MKNSDQCSQNSVEKYHQFFDTEHLKDDLRDRSIRGGLSTMAAEVISFVLRIGSTIVLARMLMPEHFGLISMVTALTTIAERFKDFGLSSATVQRKEITHEQVSTLFWINAGLGVLIMLIVAALSYVISWFYNESRLVPITLALSISFFFSGLAMQHQALLRRQMRFGHLAWVQIVSNGLSIAIGIGLAWNGFEYWALVWKEVSRAIFIAIGTWLICRWWPGLPVLSSGIGSMLRFGRDITAISMIYFFSMSLDQILIGKFWGAGPLGFYRQAYQLVSVPMSQLGFPVDYVAVPLLSILQKEPEKYRQYYRKIISILSFVSMPIAVYLTIFSDDLVLLLLGSKWIESAPIFRALAAGAFIQPLAFTCGFVILTCGHTKRGVWWGAMNAIAVIIAFCIGVHWGPLGVGTAYAVCTYITFVPSLWYGFKNTPVSLSLFFEAISKAAISSFVMGLLLMSAYPKISTLSISLKVPFTLVLAFLIYCGVWLFLPGGRSRLVEFFRYPLTAFKTAQSVSVNPSKMSLS